MQYNYMQLKVCPVHAIKSVQIVHAIKSVP